MCPPVLVSEKWDVKWIQIILTLNFIIKKCWSKKRKYRKANMDTCEKYGLNPGKCKEKGRWKRTTGDWDRILHAALLCRMDILGQCALSGVTTCAVLPLAVWRWPLWWWLLCCVQLWLQKMTWRSRIYHTSHKAALQRWVWKSLIPLTSSCFPCL